MKTKSPIIRPNNTQEVFKGLSLALDQMTAVYTAHLGDAKVELSNLVLAKLVEARGALQETLRRMEKESR